MMTRQLRLASLAVLVALTAPPSVWAKAIRLGVGDRTPASALLQWQADGVHTVDEYRVTIREKGAGTPLFQLLVDDSVGMVDGTQRFFRIASDRDGKKLKPETEYEFQIVELPSSESSGTFAFVTTPADVPNAKTLPRDDPFARRAAAAGRLLSGAGDFNAGIGARLTGRANVITAQGTYLFLQAEARKRIAEAFDLELDNRLKLVAIYFARRETNEVGKMRLRGLADLRKDQTLQLKDTAAKRRYEYIQRHAATSGGQVDNLEFLKDKFLNTQIGYGTPLEELFSDSGFANRWNLTPEMLSDLRVRSRSSGGAWLEFSLDQQSAIELDWPSHFMEPGFRDVRLQIDAINDELSNTTDREVQFELAGELADAFAMLGGEFLAFSDEFLLLYGPTPHGVRDMGRWIEFRRAEDFLQQKYSEMQFMRANPKAVSRITRSFVPEIHGRDAGTLIAWMNARGVSFAKPRPGGEASYSQLFVMMHELYALVGEPVVNVAPVVMPALGPAPYENGPAGESGPPGENGPPGDNAAFGDEGPSNEP